MTELEQIADRILSWYSNHHRDLPWRHTQDPYSIWVSEVMLQQTQVETVIPYYHLFLSRFPSIEALAGASLQEVLKVWENLGYYTRARHLHASAREIMARWGGEIPMTWDELISLPGIGSYTASAIMSFAFGKRVATVDGNVRRVLSRLLGIMDSIDTSQGQRRISEAAAGLIPRKDPARFNHAIMELGATVCTPRRPLCGVCPVQDFCVAFVKGLQETLPVTRKKGPLPHKQMTAAIIADRQRRLLIVQRPPNGLLGGLWKFPGGLCEPEENIKQGLRRAVREELGIRIRVQGSIISVKHAFTHFRITLYAFRCARRNGRPRALVCNRYRWVSPQNLVDFPFSRADRKLIEAL